MADFLRIAQDECNFWRTLVEQGIRIRKYNGAYCVYDDHNTLYWGSDNAELDKVMHWVKANILQQKPKQEATSYLLTALYNKGFGAEFVHCAILVSADVQQAQAQAHPCALQYFTTKLPKYKLEDARIRPILPQELSKYDKLERIEV